MKAITKNTWSQQTVDVSPCFKIINNFCRNTIAQQLHSKNVDKGFATYGLTECFEEPSLLTCHKYLFLMLYRWSFMRSLSFCLIQNNGGCKK